MIPVACAAVSLLVCGTAVLGSLSIRDWRVSALVRMSEAEPMAAIARAADPDFAFVHPQAHYDGVYFYAIATDPLARGEAHELIAGDRGAYRYGHAGLGWLAWLLSAGRTSAVPAALLVIGLASTALAAYALSLLGRELGWTPWAGLIVAFSPGIIYAVTADTSEPLALAALALSLVAWARGRLVWAAIALMAGCFVKEPLLLAPVGLGAWTLIEAIRGRYDRFWKRIVCVGVGPTLYTGWYLYLREVFGVWPAQQASEDFISFPLSGWIDSLRRAASMATEAFERMQIGNASVALIVMAGAILLIGLLVSLRLKDLVDPVFFLLALLTLCLNWYGILYPKDLLREITLPLALAPFVLFGRRSEGAPPPS